MKKTGKPRVVSGTRGTGETQPEAKTPEVKKPVNGEVTFYTRHGNLELVLNPARTQVIDGQVIPINEKTARFVGGIYRTSDPAVIERLRKGKTFGVRYYEASNQTVLDALKKKGLVLGAPKVKSGSRGIATAQAQAPAPVIDLDESPLPPGSQDIPEESEL